MNSVPMQHFAPASAPAAHERCLSAFHDRDHVVALDEVLHSAARRALTRSASSIRVGTIVVPICDAAASLETGACAREICLGIRRRVRQSSQLSHRPQRRGDLAGEDCTPFTIAAVRRRRQRRRLNSVPRRRPVRRRARPRAFEPVPTTATQLRLATVRFGPRVVVHEVALGEHAERRRGSRSMLKKPTTSSSQGSRRGCAPRKCPS